MQCQLWMTDDTFHLIYPDTVEMMSREINIPSVLPNNGL